jgi:hypothetical protein
MLVWQPNVFLKKPYWFTPVFEGWEGFGRSTLID